MDARTLDFYKKEAFRKIMTKIATPDSNQYQCYLKIIAKYHFEVKAVIQVRFIFYSVEETLFPNALQPAPKHDWFLSQFGLFIHICMYLHYYSYFQSLSKK